MAARTTWKPRDTDKGAATPMATIEEPSFAAPVALDAEMSVLGSMLLDNDCIDEVGAILSESHFWEKKHGRIYTWCLRMHEQGKPCDLMLLSKAIERQGQLAELGGLAYLSELIACVPSAANAVYYAEIVRDKALEREAISLFSVARADVLEGQSVIDVLSTTQNSIDKLLAGEVQEVTHEALVTAEMDRIQNKEVVPSVSTGFNQLDELTGGLHPHEYIVIGARPGVGKTTLALNLVKHIAARHLTDDPPVPVLFATYEMHPQDLVRKLISSLSRIGEWHLRVGTPSIIDGGQKVLEATDAMLFSRPIYWLNSRDTVEHLTSKIRLYVRKHGVKVVFVDYLQLVPVAVHCRSLYERVTHVSESLLQCAGTNDVAVVALSQFNRAPEHRQGKEPEMSDLRESGAIEQDATGIWLLHDESNHDDRTRCDMVCRIAKNRFGPSGGKAYLVFDKTTSYFRDGTPHHDAR